ncbi:fimbrial protein [Pseudomonas sp. PH1b]|uniref:fimbrial protein n=1 Tax=Pseudomonas sp. PH1b TaxID=1397282 RepID=UPI0004681639|nr:fimbrial protein [Pseudomonas sp. PH1b]
MRIIILLLAIVFLTMAFDTARADNPNNCYWWNGNSSGDDTERREFSVDASSTMKFQMVAVGKVMATSAVYQMSGEHYKCPVPPVITVKSTYAIAPDSGAELESGYRDVYKTGVVGIGIRFKVSGSGLNDASIPASYSYANHINSVNSVVTSLRYEFVRTAQGVGSGDLRLNFKIRFMVDQWYAANININGITQVETGGYFAGCAGVKKNISVPMGKVWAGDMQAEATPSKSFDLDVLCTGLPAASKLPVKVYFEGNSSTDGRLSLNALGAPGVARGVEVSLLGGSGDTPLPFHKSYKALSMQWTATSPQGELYNLPIKARYVKIGWNSQVKPGKADATLNYILEYN